VATKGQRIEDIIEKEMPGFRVAKTAKPAADAVKALAADAITPDLETLRKKYKMSAPAKKPSAPVDAAPRTGKAQMVVIEPKKAGAPDSPSKRMTVVVRDGKIRARQG